VFIDFRGRNYFDFTNALQSIVKPSSLRMVATGAGTDVNPFRPTSIPYSKLNPQPFVVILSLASCRSPETALVALFFSLDSRPVTTNTALFLAEIIDKLPEEFGWIVPEDGMNVKDRVSDIFWKRNICIALRGGRPWHGHMQ
jgi:hypothetical protein